MVNSSPDLSLEFTGADVFTSYCDRVRPVRLRLDSERSLYPDEFEHMIIEGDNLNVMVALFHGSFGLKGQVDLLLWDPPYNTGKKDFRYRDDFRMTRQELKEFKANGNGNGKWEWVECGDPEKHAKWTRFMMARLFQGKKLLKNGGVIAVCIGPDELFYLGLLMNKLFGEKNRLGIINWQKKYAVKSDSKHISPTTEYVLIYTKSEEESQTSLLERTEKMNSKYKNPDGDLNGPWQGDNPMAKEFREKTSYGIQSPFTGEIHYPTSDCHWRFEKKKMKMWLEQWGSEYIEVSDPKCKAKALVLRGSMNNNGQIITPQNILSKAQKNATRIYHEETWPTLFFLKKGKGRPRVKRYLNDIKQGRVPTTFFEEYDEPLELGCQSWKHTESGHTDGAKKLLNSILGDNHGFDTMKPVPLMEKIIQLWCPPEGTVLDAFAGSGTTAHAILKLNKETGANRKFILIESGQGNDRFCDTLSAERLRRVIKGNWAAGKTEPVPGGFTYYKASGVVTKKEIINSDREWLADVIRGALTDGSYRANLYIDRPDCHFFIGKTVQGNGIALVWGEWGTRLTRNILEHIKEEGERLELKKPYLIYATANLGPEGVPWIDFRQIPNSILSALRIEEEEED